MRMTSQNKRADFGTVVGNQDLATLDSFDKTSRSGGRVLKKGKRQQSLKKHQLLRDASEENRDDCGPSSVGIVNRHRTSSGCHPTRTISQKNKRSAHVETVKNNNNSHLSSLSGSLESNRQSQQSLVPRRDLTKSGGKKS